MKMHNQDLHPVQVQGGNEIIDFTVALNAKTFKALSDTLYENKIGSIVRELSCNARDAHSVAGNGNPFEIHLPDNFEPYFTIRDYGTGISPEDIKIVYCKYFESTKTQTNKEIGCHGLGSKTPFAYTDSFTVISYQNGIKRVYNAHLNNGIPQCIQLGEDETTDEPNGLEVTVPVKAIDFSEFRNEIKEQLMFFDQKPNIVNGDIEWYENNVVLEVNGFKQYEKEPYSNRNSFWIIQGGVGYPLDSDTIHEYARKNNIECKVFKNLRNIAYHNLFSLEMPIGTVDVTLSREGISYDNKTIKNILNAFNKVSENIETNLLSEIDKTHKKSSPYEFCKTINGIANEFLTLIKVDTLRKKYNDFWFTDNYVCLYKLDEKFDGMRYDNYHYKSGKLVKNNVSNHFRVKEGDDHVLYNLTQFPDRIVIKDIRSDFVRRLNEVNCKNLLVLPEGISKDDLEEIFTETEFFLASEIAVPKLQRGGRPKSNNEREYFVLTDCISRSIKRGFYETLVRLSTPEEKEITIEKIEEDTVCFFTKFNKLTINNNDNIPLEHFCNFLKNKGFNIIAAPEKDKKYIDKNSNIITIDEAWKKYEDSFIDNIKSIIADAVKVKYNNTIKNIMTSNKWRWRILKDINSSFKFSWDFSKVDDIKTNAKTCILELRNLLDEKQDKDYLDAITKIAGVDISGLEEAMCLVGYDQDIWYMDFCNQIKDDILNNMEKIATWAWLNNYRVDDINILYEVNGNGGYYGKTSYMITRDEIKNALKSKVDNEE